MCFSLNPIIICNKSVEVQNGYFPESGDKILQKRVDVVIIDMARITGMCRKYCSMETPTCSRCALLKFYKPCEKLCEKLMETHSDSHSIPHTHTHLVNTRWRSPVRRGSLRRYKSDSFHRLTTWQTADRERKRSEARKSKRNNRSGLMKQWRQGKRREEGKANSETPIKKPKYTKVHQRC